ncbi:MAG: LD-carboxypeptidase [Bacteroidetes bacterium]|nr:LD-carboxypeptidase [Bacteroidota bacterium]
MIKIPRYLKRGDTIGLTCPAGYMEYEKTKKCIATLKKWGYNVIVGKTVGGASLNYFSGTDEERLADLQEMMDDSSILAILCGRGGYGMGRIIEQINFKKFIKNPKWIIGFSDITILHAHIHSRYNIATLHAPMAAAFNEGGYKKEYVQSLRQVLTGKSYKYSATPNQYNRTGTAEGILVGGNLSLLAHICGTSSDINTKGKILFIEDVGEYLYNIDRMLYQLKRNGKFEKLAGLIAGGFTDMKDTTRPFGKTIYEIFTDLLSEYNFPVCYDFPVSHGKENYALKVGVPHHLKISRQKAFLREM